MPISFQGENVSLAYASLMPIWQSAACACICIYLLLHPVWMPVQASKTSMPAAIECKHALCMCAPQLPICSLSRPISSDMQGW